MKGRAWVFSNPERFGDWEVIHADSEEQARKLLRNKSRAKARRLTSIREFIPTSERRAAAEREGLPFPAPFIRNRRRRRSHDW